MSASSILTYQKLQLHKRRKRSS